MRTYVVPDGADQATQEGYSEIIAIHAALLETGKVVYFSGDQHDPGQFAHSLFDSSRLFDCGTGAISECVPAPAISDLFCCGHAFLADGRLLIAGGTARFDGFEGSKSAWIFDPATSTFDAAPDMADGRWYPTLMTLGNGSVLAVSGVNLAGSDQNRQLEVFTPSGAGGSWVVYGMVSDAFGTLYPRMHLLPDGRVFFVTAVGTQCATWTLLQPSPQPFCGPPNGDPTAGFSSYTSVLLPLLPEEDYAARILVADLQQPQVLDLSVSSPAWANTGARNVPLDGVITNTTPARVNGCLVILPTGDVLSCGGEETGGSETNPVHALELYRPQTNSWLTLPVATTVNRNYHSVALLLPDGRVWMAGSDKGCKWSFHDPGDYPDGEPTDEQESKLVNGVEVLVDNRELRIEIFEPWYVGRADRPAFTVGSGVAGIGTDLHLTLDDDVSISRVALIRAGTCTHAFDCDQRYVGVPFTQSGTSITAHVPDNANLLPPGPYLVIVSAQVVDDGTGATLDVPSAGVWVRVENVKHHKELKFEIDHLHIKQELEHLRKEIVESVDPGQIVVDPPPEVTGILAQAVDNLERQVAELRPFIKASERPPAPFVSQAALDAVPINPIAPVLMAEQTRMPMEGMAAMEGMEGMEGAHTQMPAKSRNDKKKRTQHMG
jgi:galactose oxidase-like protein